MKIYGKTNTGLTLEDKNYRVTIFGTIVLSDVSQFAIKGDVVCLHKTSYCTNYQRKKFIQRGLAKLLQMAINGHHPVRLSVTTIDLDETLYNAGRIPSSLLNQEITFNKTGN